jgi:hypothetical protein
MQYENCVVQHFGMAKLCNSGVQQKILKANFNFSLNQIRFSPIFFIWKAETHGLPNVEKEGRIVGLDTPNETPYNFVSNLSILTIGE